MIRFQIIDSADQQFGAVLNRRRVTIRLRYNPATDRWSIDLSIDNLPVLHGQRIVLGINLLAGYDFGIGQIFAVAHVPGAQPDRVNLPNGNVRLYHISDEEIDAHIESIDEPNESFVPTANGIENFTNPVAILGRELVAAQYLGIDGNGVALIFDQNSGLMRYGDGSEGALGIENIVSFSRVGTAPYVNARGVAAEAPENTFRLDFDPTTKALKGLLLTAALDEFMEIPLGAWFDPTKFTVLIEAQYIDLTSADRTLMSLTQDGTLQNEQFDIRSNLETLLYTRLRSGGVNLHQTSFTLDAGQLSAAPFRLAYTADPQEAVSVMSGEDIVTSALTGFPVDLTRLQIGRRGTSGLTNRFDGYLRKLIVLPRKMSAAELQYFVDHGTVS